MGLFKKNVKQEDTVLVNDNSNIECSVHIVVEANPEVTHRWLNGIGVYPVSVTSDLELAKRRFNADDYNSMLIIVESGKGSLNSMGKRDSIFQILSLNDEFATGDAEDAIVDNTDSMFDDEESMFEDSEEFDSTEISNDRIRKIVKLIYIDKPLKDDMRSKYNDMVKERLKNIVGLKGMIDRSHKKRELLMNEPGYVRYSGAKTIHKVIVDSGYKIYKGTPCKYELNLNEILRQRVTGLPPEVSMIKSFKAIDVLSYSIVSNTFNTEASEEDSLIKYKVKI